MAVFSCRLRDETGNGYAVATVGLGIRVEVAKSSRNK